MGKKKAATKVGRCEQPENLMSATQGLPLKEQRPGAVQLGGEVDVISDYLDMEATPSDGGLAHCGYLVLHCGERLRVLYKGSVEKGDEGWLYGEVTRSLGNEPLGRRGWFPAHVVRVAAEAAPVATGVAPTVASTRPAASAGTAPESSPQLQQQQQHKPRLKIAKPQVVPGSTAKNARPPGGVKKLPVSPVLSEAFPPLAQDRQGAWGGNPEQSVWQTPGSGQGGNLLEVSGHNPMEELEPPRVQRKPASEIIAEHRAAAAKAAAAAASQGGNVSSEEQCPICMEPYMATGRRRTATPCCGTELCVQCDHKSLRSKRCYFCREDGDDFPALGIACRVATNG